MINHDWKSNFLYVRTIICGGKYMSAAMSNDVKMMEFVLQRISSSTKQRMLKMKNKQEELPSDLLKMWAPSIHSLFPLKFRQVVKAVLTLGAKRQDGTPYYPQTHFYKLPKDVLFIILQYAAVQFEARIIYGHQCYFYCRTLLNNEKYYAVSTQFNVGKSQVQ
jgi:hypothetical protein